jgi:hypothetical protein
MQIDLNNPKEFTLENLRKLIASKDDSACRQLRVTECGFAILSDKVASEDLDGILFRLDTWNEGNSYVGPDAANDDWHVLGVFEALRANWPNPTSTYIELY